MMSTTGRASIDRIGEVFGPVQAKADNHLSDAISLIAKGRTLHEENLFSRSADNSRALDFYLDALRNIQSYDPGDTAIGYEFVARELGVCEEETSSSKRRRRAEGETGDSATKALKRFRLDDEHQQKRTPCDATRSDASMQLNKSMSTSLYIYQRDVYDEGMNSPCFPMRVDHAKYLESGPSRRSARRWSRSCRRHVAMIAVLNIGIVYQRNGDLDRATRFYAKAESTRKMSFAGEASQAVTTRLSSDAAIIRLRMGQINYLKGELATAQKDFEESLTIGRSVYGLEDKPYLAATMNCLAVVQYHSEKQASQLSLDLCKESLSLWKEIHGAHEHAEVATVLNNIGRIHDNRGEYDEALQAYNEALRIRRTILPENDMDTAAVIFNIGETYHTKNDIDEALENYRAFLVQATDVLGEDHRDIATTRINIAIILSERGDRVSAMDLYQKALDARKRSLGENHKDVAAVLNKIAALHHKNGDNANALKCFRQGLEIEKLTGKVEDESIIIALNNIAFLLGEMEQFQEAIEVQHEILERRIAQYGENHEDSVDTMFLTGRLYFRIGNSSEAIKMFQRALSIKRASSDDGEGVARILHSIGLALFKKRMFGEAIRAFNEAIRIMKELFGENHEHVSSLLYNLGLVYHRTGMYVEALSFCRQALRAERATLGSNHRDVSQTLFSIGILQRRMGDHDDALKTFREVLQIERILTSNNHEDIEQTLNQMGNIHLLRGELTQAMEAFSESLRMSQSSGIESNCCVEDKYLSLYCVGLLHPPGAAAA